MALTRKLGVSLVIAFSFACGLVSSPTAFGRTLSEKQTPLIKTLLQRPKEATPLSQTELLAQLRNAHELQFGYAPNRSRLAMAWAQVALENAQGEVIWNHNLGNVGPRKNDVWYRHSSLTTYRSFETFAEGGMAYWRTVSHCQSTLAMFDAGWPGQVAENLKRCGYFGADVQLYIDGMNRLYIYALTKVIPNEERARKEKERASKDWEQYQSLFAFTPTCGCSGSELWSSNR